MDQKIINLYDMYTHQPLERSVFLERLAAMTGSLATALGLVPLLEANRSAASIVADGDARIETGRVSYPGTAGEVKGYVARPKGGSQFPAVIVIHENRGLNQHVEDVTRRLALEGFLALSPDLLSPLGGTPENEDTARDMIGKLDPKQTVQDLLSAVAFLKSHSNGNGKVGAVGFCWGGGAVNQLAVNSPDLDAAVAYYGPQPKAEGVPNIKAPLLLHYAGLDARVNEGIPAFEAALKGAHKTYTLHLYEGANHAFNNDTTEARYHKEAAELSWSRTIAFLKQNLNG